MSTEARSVVYWFGAWIGLLFLVPELLAHFGVIRLYTLSGTTWRLEDAWPTLSLLLELFLAVLLLHIVFRLSAAALIATVVLAVVALGVHLLS